MVRPTIDLDQTILTVYVIELPSNSGPQPYNAEQAVHAEKYEQGRNFEISFLGGLASLKVGTPNNMPQLENRSPTPNPKPQLEDPETIRIRELTKLAQMVEKKLITLEEYNRMKKQIIKTF